MDGARRDFLARAGLAEQEHRHVRRRDQLDALHRRAQPRLGADDVLRQILAAQPREQRLAIGLGRLAQRVELRDPAVVLERDRERLRQRLRDLLVLALEVAGRPRDQQQHARRLVAAQERGDEDVAVDVVGEQAREALREAGARAARGPAAAQEHGQLLQRGRCDRVAAERGGVGVARVRRGNRLEARVREVDPAHQETIDGQPARQRGRAALGRLADFDVPADLAPDVEQQGGKALHDSLLYDGFTTYPQVHFHHI